VPSGGAGGKGHQQFPSKERLKQPGPLPAILQLSRAESEHLRLLSSQASWPNSRCVGVSKQAVPSITERSGPIFELVKEHLSGISMEIDTITRNLYAEGQWIILEEHDDGNNASDFSATLAFGEFGGFEWQNALDQSTPSSSCTTPSTAPFPTGPRNSRGAGACRSSATRSGHAEARTAEADSRSPTLPPHQNPDPKRPAPVGNHRRHLWARKGAW
jgi:hypothetical protein